MDLDSPERYGEIRRLIESKPSLKKWYEEIYRRYEVCLNASPPQGLAIELGSGASLVKDYLPEIISTDVIPYPGIDKVIDATEMDFVDDSLRAIFMMNVLHHIPEPKKFFKEATRCLRTNGRILIVDQFPGIISKPLLKYVHHEPFDDRTASWNFPSKGPLSGANGALAWIIFYRDRTKFESLFPELQIINIELHTPLRYWLSGGLKSWSLLPTVMFGLFSQIDQWLIKLMPFTASFVTVEIKKN